METVLLHLQGLTHKAVNWCGDSVLVCVNVCSVTGVLGVTLGWTAPQLCPTELGIDILCVCVCVCMCALIAVIIIVIEWASTIVCMSVTIVPTQMNWTNKKIGTVVDYVRRSTEGLKNVFKK